MKGREMDDKKQKKKNNTIQVVLCVIVGILILAVLGYTYYVQNQKAKEREMAYTELLESISKSEVEEIKMTTGSYQVKVILKGEGEESERTKTVLLPSVQAFTEYVQDKFDNNFTSIQKGTIMETILKINQINSIVIKNH